MKLTKFPNFISKLKEQFQTINFISIDTSIEDWKQLLIMSNCEHNIISNSSFSFWGAYFNNNNNKIVFHPDLWYGIKGPQINPKDICPLNWYKSKDDDKIILMIISCKQNLKRFDKLKSYWINKLNYKYVILLGDNTLTKGDYRYDSQNNYLYVSCEDNYDELPHKVYYGISNIKKIFNPEKIFKIDDDVFINVDRFKEYIRSNTKNEYEGKYVSFNGGINNNYNKFTYSKNRQTCHLPSLSYCGGPMYFLGKNAIDILCKYMDPDKIKFEDVNVGFTLMQHNIKAINTNLYEDFYDSFINNNFIAWHDASHTSI